MDIAQNGRMPTSKRRPTIAALPHTGSALPLVVIAGLLSLIAAAALRLRLSQNKAQATENG